MLADARLPNDDASYEGPQSDSVFSLDYYRNKAREFQLSLTALDNAWHAAQSALVLGVDEETAAYIVQWLDEFESQRYRARMIADVESMSVREGIDTLLDAPKPSIRFS